MSIFIKTKDIMQHTVMNNINVGAKTTFRTKTGETSLKGINIKSNGLEFDTNKLNISAAKNSSSYTYDKKSLDGTYNIITQDVNLALAKDKTRTNTLTHQNSTINNTGELIVKSDKTTLAGVNVKTNTIKLDTNDLEVKSLQDTISSNQNSKGISAGTQGLGGHYSSTTINSNMVNNQTSIIVQNGGTMNINNHTKLDGAVVQNISKHNKLNFNTNTLTVTNINDKHKEKTKGINANHSKDVDTVGLQYAKKDKEQLTQTTLANIDINIKDKVNSTNISTINKDITKSQIITKDKEIKAIGISATFKSKQQKEKDAKNSWSKTGIVLGTATGEVVTNVGGSKEDAKKVASAVENGYEVGTNTVNTLGTNFLDKSKDKTLANKGTDLIGLLPNKTNSGATTEQITALINGDMKLVGKSKNIYINGIGNNLQQAQEGADNIIGKDKDKANYFNPTHGILSDLVESAVDKFGNTIGIRTGNSYQTEEFLENNKDKNIYLHSQAHLIAQEGAKNEEGNGHTFSSYGAPMSESIVKNIFKDDKGKKPKELEQNDGDYVSKPFNIFNPNTWNKPGHGTENYGESKRLKELKKEKENVE